MKKPKRSGIFLGTKRSSVQRVSDLSATQLGEHWHPPNPHSCAIWGLLHQLQNLHLGSDLWNGCPGFSALMPSLFKSAYLGTNFSTLLHFPHIRSKELEQRKAQGASASNKEPELRTDERHSIQLPLVTKTEILRKAENKRTSNLNHMLLGHKLIECLILKERTKLKSTKQMPKI